MSICIKDKTFLITGSTNGIGMAAALKLAEDCSSLFFTYRNDELADQLKKELSMINPELRVQGFFCDFSNQESIRDCVSQIKENVTEIDLLVNNAGIVNTKYIETNAGIEQTFAVNHIGYFLFTNLLLDVLERTGSSRIINVSSAAHFFVKSMNWDDLNYKEDFGMGVKSYGQSKLANILFTRYLAKRLESKNIPVNSMHPGGVNTALGSQNKTLLGKVLKLMLKPFFRSPLKGAESIIYLAHMMDLDVTGQYFVDSKIAKTSSYSKDDAEAEKLWKISEELVNQEFSL